MENSSFWIFEFYFIFSHHELIGNDGYYTDNIEATPDNVKYAGKMKFEPKVLVWLAISSNEGYFSPSYSAIGCKSGQFWHLYWRMLAEIEAIYWGHACSRPNHALAGPSKQSLWKKKHWIGSNSKIYHLYRKRTIHQMSHTLVQSKIFGQFSNVKCTRRAGKLKPTSN